MSTLFIVATPIGNLEDMSPRAIRVLKETELIAAEDTRHTGKLLHHFKIDTPMTSYFEHNKIKKIDRILAALNQGDIALVSDAGTPGLNDPGYLLIKAALEAGHTISPIPGPTAPIAALVASGISTDRFLFLGYLPRKSGDRQRALEKVKELSYTLIFLESPHRLVDSIADMQVVFNQRQIAVAAELTKMYENIFRGTLQEASTHFTDFPARGEYTIIVAGNQEKIEPWSEESLTVALKSELANGQSPSQIAKEISIQSHWPRRKIYDLLTSLQKENHD
jgi:16S rRNA (cytidine1402-2'-O)-methyltransferase